jgi:hypothetical protein
MTRRLAIIEPHLRSVGGHCYDYVRVIAGEALSAGMAVEGVFHAAADADVSALGFPFLRVFHAATRVAETRTGLGRMAVALMGEAAANRLRRAVLGAPGTEEETALMRAAAFGDELAEAIAGIAWRSGDRAYFPTVFWPEAAIVARQAEAITRRGAAVSVCLRFDPPQTDEAKAHLRHAAETNRAIDWCADTDELAASYGAILGANVRAVRVPIDLDGLATALSARAPPLPVTVAFIGESRREKGFHLLPDVIEAVRQQHGEEARFLVQVLGDTSADREIAAAARRLRAMAGVEILSGALDQRRFQGALAAAHVLLLPYQASAYQRRSSSLLVEGIAAGLALVTPAEPSWISRTLSREKATLNAFPFAGGAAQCAEALSKAIAAVKEGRIPQPRRPDCATIAPAPWLE